MAQLGDNYHGKQRVRIAKVRRRPDGVQELVELRVRIELHGGTSASFTAGDNSSVVATDTCKNHVYMLAKTHPCHPPEQFAVDLARTFLKHYGHVNMAGIQVEAEPWKRWSDPKGTPHAHGYVKDPTFRRVAEATLSRARSGDKHIGRVTSKIEGLDVLKTTQSGWSNFHVDTFRTLPDTEERILATRVSASWIYKLSGTVDYDGVHDRVRGALLDEFYGPPDGGHFSPGVQFTLFQMGRAALVAAPEIEQITLRLPNLHFLPCAIPVYAKNSIRFEDDVYIPTDEPHGIISATIARSRARL